MKNSLDTLPHHKNPAHTAPATALTPVLQQASAKKSAAQATTTRTSTTPTPTPTPVLQQTPTGLCLTNGTLTLQANFKPLLKRTAPHVLRSELLIRAAKIKTPHTSLANAPSAAPSASANLHPSALLPTQPSAHTPIIFDACAGLGEDAFLLAATGAQVYLFEKDPTIAALTQDALLRAKQDPDLAPIVARMTLLRTDCIPVFTQLARSATTHLPSALTKALNASESADASCLSTPDDLHHASSCANATGATASHNTHLPSSLPQHPDVIYLDPMFPPKTKQAATKKKFQLLHELEQPCQNEAALLAAAQSLHPKKIVIKRPVKGPYLAGIKPSYSLKGTSIRYDCFALPSQ